MRAFKSCSIPALSLPILFGLSCLLISNPTFHAQTPVAANSLKEPPKEMSSYREIVKHVLPAVVSIEVKSATPLGLFMPRRQAWPNDFDLPAEFRRFFDDTPLITEIPRVERHGFGSGFVADPKGVIVTNHHVVNGAQQVTVHLQDGRKFESNDIKSDPKSDLAVIRIDAPAPLPHVEFADSASAEIGDRVLAMGAPFGFAGSVTSGIISGKGRNPNLNAYEDYLQTDAAINPGNSGGPLVNLDGKVVGVNSAIKTNSGGSQGVGFAIPSDLVRNVMDQLLKNGVVQRGYLGVQIRKLDPEIGARLGAGNRTGVEVGRVVDGSPAAKAGIKPGDVLMAIGGTPIAEPSDVQRRIVALAPGKTATVTVLRDGTTEDVQVTLEERPVENGSAKSLTAARARMSSDGIRVESLGMDVADLNAARARQFGFESPPAGAVVTRVEPGSFAGRAGVSPGALIVRVDDTKVASAAEANDAVQRASLSRGVVLQMLYPDGGSGYVMLKSN